METKALYSISYGMYVIGSVKGDKINAQIANTVIQTSSNPPTISVCINKSNLTHEFIKDSGVFTVSILSRNTPLSFIGQLGFKSGRDTDKMSGINYKHGETKAPVILDHTVAYLEAKVIGSIDIETHTDFVGTLVNAVVLSNDEPMTYAYYHEVKQGTVPKSAPHYIEEKKEVKPMSKYKCQVCGYDYDPVKGDPENNIAPGTPFEKLPDDWVCPVCNAPKSEFIKI
ncbi:MAG: flavin reductase [Chloroflexi bacterium]|nr:flavin reductase [Chloroflexota bacterium]